ncbi:lysis system i-spanin subunit Rz [Enterobacter roggenkampii]|uniref:lysis system i-spanin subunit Rz n=1 Tax=Enterobacter roggenkampii TaxID=1812935 RepID=UPI002FF609A5
MKVRYDEQSDIRIHLEYELNLLDRSLKKAEEKIQINNEMDNSLRKELRHAKENIDNLQRSLVDSERRLFIRGCDKVEPNLYPASSGMADGARSGSACTFEQDYFDLRRMIEHSKIQIKGLQDYIKEQCLKN